MASHFLDSEEEEQDNLKIKLDKITITNNLNLDNMNNQIIVNGAVNNTQDSKLEFEHSN